LEASVNLIPKLPNPVKETTDQSHSFWTNYTTMNLMRKCNTLQKYDTFALSQKLWRSLSISNKVKHLRNDIFQKKHLKYVKKNKSLFCLYNWKKRMRE
jgi:hypothetical protein